MARLKQLPSRLAAMPARLQASAPVPGDRQAQERQRFKARDEAQPGRAWYKTARWQKLRWSVLVRDLFTCARCGRIEGNTSRLVADHIVAHRGDEALFWDGANLQCLCKACHDSDKQREERAGW